MVLARGNCESYSFCIYLDGLFHCLSESGVGCFIRHVFTGAYADDVVLLAPTPSAMRVLLNIFEEYGKEFSVAFNAVKSVCMQVSKVSQSSVVPLKLLKQLNCENSIVLFLVMVCILEEQVLLSV